MYFFGGIYIYIWYMICIYIYINVGWQIDNSFGNYTIQYLGEKKQSISWEVRSWQANIFSGRQMLLNTMQRRGKNTWKHLKRIMSDTHKADDLKDKLVKDLIPLKLKVDPSRSWWFSECLSSRRASRIEDPAGDIICVKRLDTWASYWIRHRSLGKIAEQRLTRQTNECQDWIKTPAPALFIWGANFHYSGKPLNSSTRVYGSRLTV